MPILQPSGQLTFTISDLEQSTIRKVENRQTDVQLVDEWLRDALIEISSNPDYRDDFDQLEILGTPFNLTSGQQEYPFSNLLPPTPTTGIVPINDATLDIMIWIDYPTNNIRQKLNPTHYQDADKFSAQIQLSLPREWYRFGDNFGLNPVPNNAYQVQSRMLQMHPINDNQLNTTQILLPRDWNEVLVWAAAERGFMELLEYEKASKIHTALYGDMEYQTSHGKTGQPGLISSRKKRRAREMWRQEQALRPVIKTSCWGV